MMFRQSIRSSVFIFLFAFCIFSAAGADGFSPSNFAEYTLENGMRVFVLEDFSAAPIRIEYAVRAGTNAQTPETAGFFPLYARLFTRAGQASDPTRSGSDMLSAAKVSCTVDAVRCTLTAAPSDLEKTLEALAHCAFDPSFDDELIRTHFTAMKNESMNYSLSAAGFINSSMDARIYAGEPWKQNSGVYPALFMKMPLAGVRSVLMNIARSYYVPNNSALFISGGMQKSAMLKAAEKTFGLRPSLTAEYISCGKKSAAESGGNKARQKKFVISDPLFSSDLTQIVVQYTELSASEADIAGAAFNERASSFKSAVLSHKELGIRSPDYIDAAAVHSGGKARLVFQALFEKSKTSPVKQSAAFLSCIENAAKALSSDELIYAKENLIASYRELFGNHGALMTALSELWAADIRRSEEEKAMPLIERLFSRTDTIINFDVRAFEDAYSEESPFVFVLVNSGVYKRYAKAFAAAGYESITQKNGSWYTQELYKNIQKNNSAEETADKNENEISDAAFYRAQNRAAFSSFTLANGIPVVCKQNDFSSTALLMLSVSGGELGSAANPGFFSILIYALADNIQKEIDMQKKLGTIDGTPSVRAEIDLTSGTISVESFADDMSVIIPCISRALIYGDIQPSQADGLVYNARSQKRLRDGNTANQLYSRAVAALFPDTPYTAVFDSNRDILEGTQYAAVLAAYPSLLDAGRYTLIVTGKFDVPLIRDALASSLGMLAEQKPRNERTSLTAVPVFPDNKKIFVALRHLFFTDVAAKDAGPRPETLVPTTDFSDPVQYWLPSPPAGTDDCTVFNAFLYALCARLQKDARRISADTAVHADGSTYAMQAAVITFSHARRTSSTDKMYASAVAAFGKELENETSFPQIKEELLRNWVIEKLSGTQTNRGTALLIHEGLEAGAKADTLADARSYLDAYEIIDELTREKALSVYKAYFSETAPLGLYSKDSKR